MFRSITLFNFFVLFAALLLCFDLLMLVEYHLFGRTSAVGLINPQFLLCFNSLFSSFSWFFIHMGLPVFVSYVLAAAFTLSSLILVFLCSSTFTFIISIVLYYLLFVRFPRLFILFIFSSILFVCFDSYASILDLWSHHMSSCTVFDPSLLRVFYTAHTSCFAYLFFSGLSIPIIIVLSFICACFYTAAFLASKSLIVLVLSLSFNIFLFFQMFPNLLD